MENGLWGWGMVKRKWGGQLGGVAIVREINDGGLVQGYTRGGTKKNDQVFGYNFFFIGEY